MNVQGLPKLNNMYRIDGLCANLISISQLCDDNLQVKFGKNRYNVCVLGSARSSDNCYQFDDKVVCQSLRFSELDL